MKLIDTDSLLQAAKMNGFAGESAVKFLMLLLRFRRINKIYQDNAHRIGMDFIDSMMEQIGIRFEIRPEELEKIPREGAFITVSNHPFGGIDGLLLMKLIGGIRPDYKILPNFLLKRMEPIAEYLFEDDLFENSSVENYPAAGLEKALIHLESGHPMGVFPAGEVSSFDQDIHAITDPQWQFRALQVLKRANVPVIPVYFQGKNSRLFHFMGRIHPKLQTVKLPTELFNKRRRVINIRIGTPIPVKEQNEFSDISRYGRYLRTKTYALGTSLEVKKFFSVSRRQLKKAENIADPAPVQAIESEISKIISRYLLFKIDNYNVICVPSIEIPIIMNEIGRLREITFREVGEGTNQQMDIDEYDLYYNQLFIWDDENSKIVGAYRVGKGKEIMDIYGIRGFYIQSLFRINRKMHPILTQSLELGRSFIVPEYQRRPLPLFLLWKGILYFLLKNPEYRYLIGPVSISNRFSNFSKELIIKFIREYYYNEVLARHIRPRKNFIVSLHHLDTDILIESASDLIKFDRIIKDIETAQNNVPVLLKKYLKQNGQIVGFNIDPKFNNALDGLMILDLFDVPPNTVAALSKEVNDEGLLERFAPADLGQAAVKSTDDALQGPVSPLSTL
jgi:putative hemolysin